MAALTRRKTLSIVFTVITIIGVSLIIYAFVFIRGISGGYSTYKKSGFKIIYPTEWKMTKYPDATDVKAVFVSPQSHDYDQYQENVSIIIQDLHGQSMSPTKYTKRAQEQIIGTFEDMIKVEESGSAVLGGAIGHKFIYTIQFPDQDNPVRIMHIWALKNERAYQLTYSGEVDNYDEYMPIVKKMIRSFKILH